VTLPQLHYEHSYDIQQKQEIELKENKNKYIILNIAHITILLFFTLTNVIDVEIITYKSMCLYIYT